MMSITMSHRTIIIVSGGSLWAAVNKLYGYITLVVNVAQ